MVRAVVFDLWQTLAVWPEKASRELRRSWSESLGVPAERIEEVWLGPDFYRIREAGPIASAIEALHDSLGVTADVRDLLLRRIELHRQALVPVPGALATLRGLRERGIGTGLVSNCTEEVALVWGETPFAELLDVAVFSATAGCLKPDPAIYELVLGRLGVTADDALFVGDGANDELGGAERAGMTPVLVHPPGEEPPWDGLADWRGLRITAIPQVLELVA